MSSHAFVLSFSLARSFALLVGNRYIRTLSLSLPIFPQELYFLLFLVLPCPFHLPPRRQRSLFLVSLSLWLSYLCHLPPGRFFNPIQTGPRVRTVECVWELIRGVACVYVLHVHTHMYTYIYNARYIFFRRFVERHTCGGPGLSSPSFSLVPSFSRSLRYLPLSHTPSRYAHRNCVR